MANETNRVIDWSSGKTFIALAPEFEYLAQQPVHLDEAIAFFGREVAVLIGILARSSAGLE